MDISEEQLGRLVSAVVGSPKYADISPELISAIGLRELHNRRNLSEAVKATKNKLHQVGGAFLTGRPAYVGWLAELRRARGDGDEGAFRRLCREIMVRQSSTRERVPILDQFYSTILAGLAPVHSVIDVACGLNPLSIPWMPLAEDAEYFAYDVYGEMIAFVGAFMELLDVHGSAEVRDVTQACPAQKVELALILKALPCLEQIDKDAPGRLLSGINADYILVSFPVQTLGGRNKGMAAHYDAGFRRMLAGRGWAVEQFVFPTELTYLVRCASPG